MRKKFTVHKTKHLPSPLFVNPNVMKLYLQFENNVNDLSGNGNNGTITGTPTFVAGPPNMGNAGSFGSGKITFVTIANESQFDFERTNPFSVLCWVKGTNTGVAEELVTKLTAASSSAGWVLGLTTTNTARFILVENTTSLFVDTTQTTLHDGNWHFVVGTYDGSSNRSGLKIYLDGTLSATGTASAFTNTMLNNQAVVIGAYGGGTSPITGLIDGVQIWNFVLNADQISYLYNAGNGLVLT